MILATRSIEPFLNGRAGLRKLADLEPLSFEHGHRVVAARLPSVGVAAACRVVEAVRGLAFADGCQFSLGQVGADLCVVVIPIFLSTVSDEFRAYRDQLRADLTRHNVEVKVQEDFKDLGGDTLDKLDVYIAHCDAVVHLVGDMTGSAPGERASALLAKYPDLAANCRRSARRSRVASAFPIRNGRLGSRSIMASPSHRQGRGPPNAAQNTPRPMTRAQRKPRISRGSKRFSAIPAAPSPARPISPSTSPTPPILDLLVKDYAEEAARARAVAEGFIREMAKRVAGDKTSILTA